MDDVELIARIRKAREVLWATGPDGRWKLIKEVDGGLRFECPDCDFEHERFGPISNLYGIEEYGTAHLLEHDPEVAPLLITECPKCGRRLDHVRPLVGVCDVCGVDVNMLKADPDDPENETVM